MGPGIGCVAATHEGADFPSDGIDFVFGLARAVVRGGVVTAIANHTESEVESFRDVGIGGMGAGVFEDLRSEIFVGASKSEQGRGFFFTGGTHGCGEEGDGFSVNGHRLSVVDGGPLAAPPVVGIAFDEVP